MVVKIFMDENISDIEVVKLILDGNQDMFLVVMQRYEEKLKRFLRRILNFSEEDLEDVLQDIFIKVYKNLNAFDLSLKFSSWIYRIARNEAISAYRKVKVRPQVQNFDADDDFLNRIRSDFDVKKELEQKIFAEKFRVILRDLDRKYREVIVLKYLEDYDYVEISDILKKSVGTVSALINRAKKKLKDLLEKNNVIL